MIHMEKKHWGILIEILEKYKYNFYAFGSRVSGNCKKFSDIDIFFNEEIPNNILLKLEEEFEESDLPFKVDLINYKKCDSDFQSIMLSHAVKIQ